VLGRPLFAVSTVAEVLPATLASTACNR